MPNRDDSIPSGPELAERARKLAPLLAEHAREAEQQRRPDDRVIQALREARIFDLMVPTCYGGLELDLDTFLEVGLALSEGDASMAWVSTFYIEHNWMFCQFPESFQRELFADRSHVLAPASIAPTGHWSEVEGGYRLSGRWQWATGAPHGEWVIVGAMGAGAGAPVPRFFALPMADVVVEDTWYVDGMAATGSNDVVIDDAFVATERSVPLLDLVNGCAPGSELHPGPLYQTPMVPILGLAASMPAVGLARAVVRGFRESLLERTVYAGTTKQAERATSQVRLGRAELQVEQAELLLRQIVREIQERRGAAELEERVRWVAGCAFAVHQCKAVIQSVAEASGASAHFQSHPLQRAQRDVNTLSCHAIFDLDHRLESLGRAMLGLPLGPTLA